MPKITNFITDYEDYLSDTESPRLFRTWGAVACVAGALERRVWVHNRRASLSGKIYPTQGIFHIAPTGIGKAPSVKLCQHLWDSTGTLNLSPESLTAASFYDEMAHAKKLTFDHDWYHHLNIATEEISSFFIQYNHELCGAMLKALDCSRKLDQSRRTTKRIDIPNPSLTCLFAGQPGQFNDKFPEAAYGLGFMGRCHIVYSEDAISVPFFSNEGDLDGSDLRSLEDQIEQISEMLGEVKISREAMPWIEEKHRSKREISAPHPRLEGYYERRPVHMTKVAMIRAISRGSMEISLGDFTWALGLMEATEREAPKAFQVFKNDEDSLILQTLLNELREKNTARITQAELYRWFQDRVEHIKIPILMGTLVKGEYLTQIAGASTPTFKVPGAGVGADEKVTKLR